ncbi:uncharacterized protein (DUF983 family) [Hephaestia caeni]|jgi:uncharacterized protein (DUF983 family)|uniref:Uncharacterized protein (DUF983 family) n=8 Tax=Sphingomonadaceae TaxID=41297 RepID=A0A397PL95_9SPHN|nr:Uncharacterized protein SGRAN_0609 [Sphingopyxis granuli]AMK18102.1 hypothetical protein K663_08605 [Sphingobium sp. MI1205]KEQ55593.1 hypothetical protein BV95_00232 [Sphingobium chlorophenolicum]RIA46451.1 uncharacterized protein (DUF983 family) [Hephaestia caeni]BAV63449.1 hypothetical protein SCLO_1004090 [Sphingobium cloacae]BBD97636.1 DUF983 domain-containing protein [Sphingobium amiense]
MPDLIRFPFDKFHEKPESMPAHEQGSVTGKLVLPVTGWAAILRGLRGRCPRCGEARLFMRFLKPIPHCPQCGQDWTHQQADDFPAYVSIFVTGHLMAPLIIAVTSRAEMSVPMLMAILLPLALLLMVGLLQPAKGAIIALQWWFGMHGFRRERPGAIPDDADT